MKKNIWAKIFAILALFGIILWIIGTGILFIFQSNTDYSSEVELSSEQIQELIDQQWLSGSSILEDNSAIEALGITEDGEKIQSRDSWSSSATWSENE